MYIYWNYLVITYHWNKRCQECKRQNTVADHGNYYTYQQPENVSTKLIDAKATDGRGYSWDEVHQTVKHTTPQFLLFFIYFVYFAGKLISWYQIKNCYKAAYNFKQTSSLLPLACDIKLLLKQLRFDIHKIISLLHYMYH